MEFQEKARPPPSDGHLGKKRTSSPYGDRGPFLFVSKAQKGRDEATFLDKNGNSQKVSPCVQKSINFR